MKIMLRKKIVLRKRKFSLQNLDLFFNTFNNNNLNLP